MILKESLSYFFCKVSNIEAKSNKFQDNYASIIIFQTYLCIWYSYLYEHNTNEIFSL